MQDSLGDRMKAQYENRTRYYLPRRTYTIIRLDGVNFHKWCKNLNKPYDTQLMTVIDGAAHLLVQNIQGAAFAYAQSDEISVLLTDFAKPETAAWVDGNIQKMASVTASIYTSMFCGLADTIDAPHPIITGFDARVFTIPDPVEVENYFIWRQKDCTKNSIQTLARRYYSHRQLQGVGIQKLNDMIEAAHDNWADHPERFKRGGLITRDPMGTCAAPGFVSETGRKQLRSLIPIIWAEDKETDAQTADNA